MCNAWQLQLMAEMAYEGVTRGIDGSSVIWQL